MYYEHNYVIILCVCMPAASDRVIGLSVCQSVSLSVDTKISVLSELGMLVVFLAMHK